MIFKFTSPDLSKFSFQGNEVAVKQTKHTDGYPYMWRSLYCQVIEGLEKPKAILLAAKPTNPKRFEVSLEKQINDAYRFTIRFENGNRREFTMGESDFQELIKNLRDELVRTGHKPLLTRRPRIPQTNGWRLTSVDNQNKVMSGTQESGYDDSPISIANIKTKKKTSNKADAAKTSASATAADSAPTPPRPYKMEMVRVYEGELTELRVVIDLDNKTVKLNGISMSNQDALVLSDMLRA